MKISTPPQLKQPTTRHIFVHSSIHSFILPTLYSLTVQFCPVLFCFRCVMQLQFNSKQTRTGQSKAKQIKAQLISCVFVVFVAVVDTNTDAEQSRERVREREKESLQVSSTIRCRPVINAILNRCTNYTRVLNYSKTAKATTTRTTATTTIMVIISSQQLWLQSFVGRSYSSEFQLLLAKTFNGGHTAKEKGKKKNERKRKRKNQNKMVLAAVTCDSSYG